MDNISLKLYVDDAVNTLTSLSISFIAMIRNFESNEKDVDFVKSNFTMNQSSFKEFVVIDNIFVEYLSVNILSVIDFRQFSDNKSREIANYDILKLAKRISGNEKVLNAKTFKITEFKEIYNRINRDKLLKIKEIRDQHYSHIDRKRKDETDMSVRDVIELVNLFLKMFDIIYRALKGQSIYDLSIDYELYNVKLKAFKYDIIMKYLNESKKPDLNSLRTLSLYSNFEDSYKALF